MPDSEIVVGLDIGTTKVTCAIGEFNAEGKLVIAGAATLPGIGLRKGLVANMEATGKTIADVIDQAEQEAGRTVTEVIVGLSATGVEGVNSAGVVAVTGKENQITEEDLKRVVEAARAIAVPMDREIIHVLPQDFIVDDHVAEKTPLGMMGTRLEANVHVITGAVTVSKNVVRCINKAGYAVKEVVQGTVASLGSVLSTEEREMGVLLIDIGGESTDYFLVHGSAPYLTGVLPVGAGHVTADLAYIFKTPGESAEMIKLESCCCWEPLLDENDPPVIIPGVAGRPPRSVSKKQICEVAQARMAEILQLIKGHLADKGLLYKFPGGVVLTGGGASLPGAAELASHVFQQSVRVGYSPELPGLPERFRLPAYSSVFGLVDFGASRLDQDSGDKVVKAPVPKETKPLKGLKDWLKDFF